MTNLKSKIAAASATAAMLMNVAAPLAYANSYTVSNNGSDSDSAIEVGDASHTSVVQTNETEINNKVNLVGTTGDNSNSDNTAGYVRTETGDITADVYINNVGNTNTAIVDDCDCEDDLDILVDGNGTETDNYVGVDQYDVTNVFQTNTLNLDNDVDLDLNSGGNTSDDNTGQDGEVITVTGDVDSHVSISNVANANSAVIAGTGNGGASVGVIGNGSDAASAVELGLGSAVLLTQVNDTNIRNDVSADLNSGDNSADDNTGEYVAIGTGNVGFDAYVNNVAGINDAFFATCACDDSLYAKIKGNGTGTDNFIGVWDEDAEDVFQNNVCGEYCFDNQVSADANTGNNDSDDNTGDVDSDPLTVTGHSYMGAHVDNMGGMNTFGSGSGYAGMGSGYFNGGGDVSVSVDFDLGDIMSLIGSLL